MKYPVLMKDDPLGFVFRYHHFLNNHKISIVMVLGSVLITLIFTVTSSFQLWNANHVEFLKHYSVNISLSPWIVATIFVERFILPARVNSIHPEKMWDMKTVSPLSRSKLQQSIRFKRILFAAYMLQCVVTAFVFPLIGHIFGYTVHSDIHFIRNHYSETKLKLMFYTILYVSHQIIAFQAISSYMLMKYTVQTVIIQLDILTDYLSQAKLYERNEYLSVRKHLKICAAHHIFILRLFKIVQEVCYTPFVYLLFSGQLVLLGCSIFLYYNRHPIYGLQIGSILFLSYVLAMDCCQDGQSAEDAFNEFRMKLIDFEWYEWDEISKRMLLIMLTRTQREDMLKTLGMSIDRSLMITILKFAYQAMLIFLRFT